MASCGGGADVLRWGWGMNSFLERHAHRALMALGSICIAVVLLFAARLGVLGPDLEHASIFGYGYLSATQLIYDTEINVTHGLLGALATLMGATISIAKGIRYSRKRLPHRLKELLDANTEHLIENRSAALALIQNATTDLRLKQKSLFVGPLNKAFTDIMRKNTEGARSSLNDAVETIKINRDVLEWRILNLNYQAAAAHLLRAVIRISDAQQLNPGQTGQRHQMDQDALIDAEKELAAARRLASRDTDIIEFHAQTLEHLQRHKDALEAHNKIVDIVNHMLVATRPHTAMQASHSFHALAMAEMDSYEINRVAAALARCWTYHEKAIALLKVKEDLFALTQDERYRLALHHYHYADARFTTRPNSTYGRDHRTSALQVIADDQSPEAVGLRDALLKLPTSAHSPALQ
jgi:hypothetical protein